MNAPRVRLGELLVRAGLISRGQLDEALGVQARDGRRLGTLLVEAGLVSEAQVTQILSQQLSVPWVSLHHIDFSEPLLRLVPRELVEKYCLVPIYIRRVRGLGDALYVAMDDPTNTDALTDVARHAGLHVRPMIAPPDAIRQAIRDNYGVDDSAVDDLLLPYDGDDDEGTQTHPRRKLTPFDESDDADTAVRWRKEIMEDAAVRRTKDRPARVDSVVDLEDTSDVLEIPPDDFGLAPIDDSMLTETTGTLSIDDPDVIEVSGPVTLPDRNTLSHDAPRESGIVSETTTVDQRPAALEADVDDDDAEAVPLVRAPSRPANPLPSSPAPAAAPPRPSPSPPTAAEPIRPARQRPSAVPPAAVPAGLRRSSPPSRTAAPPTQTSPGAGSTLEGGRAVATAPEARRPTPSKPAAAPAPLPDVPRMEAPVPPSVQAARESGSAKSRPPPSGSGKPVSLTLLDGTTISLPPRPGAASAPPSPASSDATLKDVIAALRASARGADATDVLGDRAKWQTMFAALLAVLVRKGLLTEAEFLDELEKG